jgi:septal ring factor EnvC (AmiA/AmiB activator)
MTVSSHTSDKTKDFGRDEAEISAFIHKVGAAIDEARSKMSDQEREEADRQASAILERASDAATGPRRSA